MSLMTDDGFIFESHGRKPGSDTPQVFRWIVLALDETEALGLLNREMPELDYKLVACGTDIRS